MSSRLQQMTLSCCFALMFTTIILAILLAFVCRECGKTQLRLVEYGMMKCKSDWDLAGAVRNKDIDDINATLTRALLEDAGMPDGMRDVLPKRSLCWNGLQLRVVPCRRMLHESPFREVVLRHQLTIPGDSEEHSRNGVRPIAPTNPVQSGE